MHCEMNSYHIIDMLPSSLTDETLNVVAKCRAFTLATAFHSTSLRRSKSICAMNPPPSRVKAFDSLRVHHSAESKMTNDFTGMRQIGTFGFQAWRY